MPTDRPRTDKTRVGYLLADPGVPYYGSRKGSSIHARSMVRAFERCDCVVEVLALRTGETPDPSPAVEQVLPARATRWWRRHALGRRSGSNVARRPPNWVVAVAWLLRQRDFWRAARKRWGADPPDLFYARHAWWAFPYARLRRALGVPLVLEVNAVFSIEKPARGESAWDGWARRVERDIFEAADLILPVSRAIAEQIAAMGIDRGKIEVLPNAVDPELFHPRVPPPATRPHDPAAPFLVGTVGSFRPYHGLGTLLRAAARLRERIPSLRLRLIGDGPQRDALESLARDLRLEAIVEFVGEVDHAHVPELLRACDVGVCPNEGQHNDYNCPMKLFEYMALELPIVASDWGDIPNIVAHGETALLHRPGDPDALADALWEVYRDPPGARQRALAARALLEGRTWTDAARRVLAWHRSVRRRSPGVDA